MKKIGIVVPVYNVGMYLERCITSVLNQTYKNIELVLVDDGSTDNSGKICDDYEKRDGRVHVIHQDNHGVLCARCTGLKKVECDYATFIDADDWIAEDTYEKMSIYMNQEVDVISYQITKYFDNSYQCMYLNSFQYGLYNKQQIEEQIFPTMIWDLNRWTYGLIPSLSNKLIKKELFINELYKVKDLPVFYGQDIAVIYPLMTRISSFVNVEEGLYYHRQRKANDIAPYILDSDYYKKLYILYEYLSKECYNHVELIKQIDYFYNYSVRLRLQIYGDKKREGDLFPFDKIPKGSKIILYGASGMGQLYHEQFIKINYGTILAWVDKNYDKYQEFEVKDIACINTIKDFDYIVIAVIYQETAESIKNNLIHMGVEEDKIVWK